MAHDELERRICQREREANDPSDATLEVLHQQIASQEPLDSDERRDVFSFPADINMAATRSRITPTGSRSYNNLHMHPA